MSLTEMLAIVADGDPVRLAAALKRSMAQLATILQHKRDEKGNVVVSEKGRQVSEREADEQIYMRRGVPRWRREELWNEKMKQRAEDAKNAEGPR